jgi:transposase-like protein
MNLPKLIQDFGSNNACRVYLRDLRWPDGVHCPRCESTSISKIGWPDDPTAKGRRQFDCGSCRYRFSVTAGTVFHDSHLPLSKWFLATYLMCESRKGISANQLKRTLAVSYEAAWYLCHRIRSAMEQVERPLAGVVEMDETYVGGKEKGRGRKGGYGHKVMVMGALEREGDIRLRVSTAKKNRGRTIQRFANSVLSDQVEVVYTDGHNAYQALDVPHEVVDHGTEEWVRGDVSTQGIESAWSLLKRSIVGSYHQLSAKHLQAYADEFAFRFNNRENPFLFRDTLLKLIGADALPYRDLVGS